MFLRTYLSKSMKTRKQQLKWKRRLKNQYSKMVYNRELLKRVKPKLVELEKLTKQNELNLARLKRQEQVVEKLRLSS